MAKRKSRKNKRSIESYQHPDKQRVNNPPVGLVTPDTDPDAGSKTYAYDPHLDPQLVWAGKAEHTSFEVPTVSLHVHERIDPRTIIEAVRKRNGEQLQQLSLFEQEEKPLRQAIEFYKHKEGWTNRLIAGDSLLVMNSLLEKEGMAGKVQMIYIDPPYGIKYASNFQPFVNKRDVKDRRDEDLTAEPEQIKAFRDTWELGIHSYLTYLRDRLLLARELLTESGSVFVQISDENVHRVRCLMDEVFGVENFVAMINFKTMTPLGTIELAKVYDYLLWYTKDKTQLKYRPLFVPKQLQDNPEFAFVETPEGVFRRLNSGELKEIERIAQDQNVFKRSDLVSSGYTPSCVFPLDFQGETYMPRSRKSWRTNPDGMQRLIEANRLFKLGRRVYFRMRFSDSPYMGMLNSWDDTAGGFTEPKAYVVETNPKVIQRCVLMTTDPGDLVFDPTCGSGTTAYVAEQWGRRWITCDTSRVAVALARQRLMTAVFDYYELAHPEEGVSSGFKYKTVPHITLRSIAHNEEIDEIAARYQPGIDQALADLNRALGETWQEWEVPRLRPHPLWPEGVKLAWDLLQTRRTEQAALGGLPADVRAALETLNRYLGTKYKQPAEVPHPIPAFEWPEEAREAIHRFWELKQKKREEIDASIQRRAPQETLYDQPYLDRKKVRVTGPFTTEAVPAPAVRSIDEILEGEPPAADASVARSGETLRQAEWRDELFRTGIRGKAGQYIRFARLEPLPGCRWLHAEGEIRPSDEGADSVKEEAPAYNPMRVVVSFGPEHAPLEQRQVGLAIEEAQRLVPKPKLIVFAAFQFDPEAAKDIDETNWSGVTLLKAQMNADLLTEDLKKKRASNESFWLIGQPDVRVERVKEGVEKGKYRVSVHGFDYYNTKTGNIESGGPDKIAIWMLDTDYHGRSLFPRQVFFPLAGPKDGWARLSRSLKAEIDPDLIEAYRGTVSLPFEAGEHRRVAVKIVDDRGIESLKIVELEP